MGDSQEASRIETTPESEVSRETIAELKNLKDDIEVKQQEKAFKEFKDIFSGNVIRITKLNNISWKEVDRLKKYLESHYEDDEIKAIYNTMKGIYRTIYDGSKYNGKDRKVFCAIYDYLKQKYNNGATGDDVVTTDSDVVDTDNNVDADNGVDADNNAEINSLKDQLLSKENMTSSDKENMKICIDMILYDILAINKKYAEDRSQVNLLKWLNDNVKYGQDYIEIWWIKYSREPIVKDNEWHAKLITWDEYIQALEQQNKKWITISDIEKSCWSLPSSIMLWVLLGIYFEWVPNLQDPDGNDVVLEENGIRSFLIGTIDKNNEGKFQGYYMQTQEILDEEDEISRTPQSWYMWSVAISNFGQGAKFFWLYKN